MILGTVSRYASKILTPPSPIDYMIEEYGDEFNGPFPDWKNIKTDFGAVGNGIANDTAAFKAALDAMNPKVNGEDKPENEYAFYVIYVPQGTYNIDAKLICSQKQWVYFVGHHPSTTKIKWIGAAGGTMLYVHSNWYSRFNRITWDGNNLAGVCIEQNRIYDGHFFDTGNQYADNVFMNAHTGLKGGFSGGDISFAEVSITRNTFINLKRGVIIGNFNALDVWVSQCKFENCEVGITNGDGGSGGWRSYRNNFYGSTVSDHGVNDVVEFAVRGCRSFGSKKFIDAGAQPNPCPFVIEGNEVEDSLDVDCIVISNHGPASIFDNKFKSKAGASGKVIRLNTVAYNNLGQTHPFNNGMMFTMNNTFTVSNPIEKGQNTLLEGDAPIIVLRENLTITPNRLNPVQPNVSRPTFEVPVGSTIPQIQAICDQAALLKGQRPVVHFPSGIYPGEGTLRFNAGLDTQLHGNGFSSRFRRIEKDPRIKTPSISIAGPTKMRVKHLLVDGHMKVANGIELSGIDQPGSKVICEQLELHGNYRGIWINKLDHTKVILKDSGITFCTEGMKVTGGKLAAAGTPAEGRTILYGGCNFINPLSFRLSDGANVLVRDYWYESNYGVTFALITGKSTFIMESSRIATGPSDDKAAIRLTNLDGKFIMVGGYLTGFILVDGNGNNAEVFLLGCETDVNNFDDLVKNQATGTVVRRSILRRVKSQGPLNPPPPEIGDPISGSFSVPDNGPAVNNAVFMENLAFIRNVDHEVPQPVAPDITDFRIEGVWCQNCNAGVYLVDYNT